MSVAIAELHDLRTDALGRVSRRGAGTGGRGRSKGSRDRGSVDGRDIEIPDTVGDVIAARLRRSPVTVRQQIAEARRLIELLPRTVGALSDGSISPEHARVIVRTSDDLEPAALRQKPVLRPGGYGPVSTVPARRFGGSGREGTSMSACGARTMGLRACRPGCLSRVLRVSSVRWIRAPATSRSSATGRWESDESRRWWMQSATAHAAPQHLSQRSRSRSL